MIKKLIHGIGIMTICLFLSQSSVLAAEKSVTFTKVDDGAQTFIEVPSEETTNPVNALQMEFKVEKLKGNAANATFEFNKAINSSVKESRYDQSTGRLTIYIAGKTDLFSKELLSDGKLELGKFVISTDDKLGAKVKISVAKNEYYYVVGNGTTLEKEPINAPSSVEVVIGNGGEEEKPQPPQPENPDPETPDLESPNQENPNPVQPEQGGAGDDTPTIDQNQGENHPAKTGDEKQPMIYLVVAIIAAIVGVGIVLFRRRK